MKGNPLFPLSLLIVVPLLLPLLFVTLRPQLKQTTMVNTETEIFGVTIEKNPPESKLTELGVTTWPAYESGPTKIPWTFKTKETMYLVEGKVHVTVEGHDVSFEIGAGDLVVFPKGMNITWEVVEDLKKHYKLEK